MNHLPADDSHEYQPLFAFVSPTKHCRHIGIISLYTSLSVLAAAAASHVYRRVSHCKIQIKLEFGYHLPNLN